MRSILHYQSRDTLIRLKRFAEIYLYHRECKWDLSLWFQTMVDVGLDGHERIIITKYDDRLHQLLKLRIKWHPASAYMCNRYRAAKDIPRIRAMFKNVPDEWIEEFDEKYDSFFPKSNVPVVLKVKGDDYFGHFSWGIVPSWAANKSTILTNTKSEEVLVKPTWKESFRRRRCLMPATSFFEPANVKGKKYQVEFTLKDGSAFAFAGLWQKTEADGEKKNQCSLLTCEPNVIVGEVHGRMPVILRPHQFDTYLNTPPEKADDLSEMLLPFPSDEMEGNFENQNPRLV